MGKIEWKPTDCWVEEEWPWTHVPSNPKNLKVSDYPGEGRLIDFFRRCVKKGLEKREIDPENHYSEDFTDKDLKKR